MDRDPDDRDPDTTQCRCPAEEPARHLRQRHQLATGAWAMRPSFRKAGMPASRIQACAHPRIGTLPVILPATTALAGCATTHKPPEIYYEYADPARQDRKRVM